MARKKAATRAALASAFNLATFGSMGLTARHADKSKCKKEAEDDEEEREG
jgi:hypothetical protein